MRLVAAPAQHHLTPKRIEQVEMAERVDAVFLNYAIRMQSGKDERIAMKTFGYSILYLMLMFALLLIDHYFRFDLT